MNARGSGLKLVLAGMLVIAILSLACLAGGKNQDPPKFHMREKKIDIGTVYEGEDIVYTFKVRNNGAGELHVVNVRPG